MVGHWGWGLPASRAGPLRVRCASTSRSATRRLRDPPLLPHARALRCRWCSRPLHSWASADGDTSLPLWHYLYAKYRWIEVRNRKFISIILNIYLKILNGLGEPSCKPDVFYACKKKINLYLLLIGTPIRVYKFWLLSMYTLIYCREMVNIKKYYIDWLLEKRNIQ